MACLDNVQIVQTVTYSSAPNTVDGYILGQIEIDILNLGGASVIGTITVDRVRDIPVGDLSDPSIEEMSVITSANESFVYNFYYPVSAPDSITINATVEIQVDDCLYQSSCNHVILAPNDGDEQSSCTVEVLGYDAVSGCTNPLYYEYNENANIDDGSCSILIPVLGCTNPLGTNYNILATKNDGSCVFPSGCTNSIANNYDSSAVIDDGSCACGDINLQLDFFELSGESFALTGDCDFFVEFDLITKIECEKFLAYFEEDTRTVLEILNSLKINAQVFNLLDDDGNPMEYYGGEVAITGTPEFLLVQEENLYEFNIANNPVGVGVKGEDEFCSTFFDLIALEQGLECQDYDSTAFDITWTNYRIALNSDLVNTFAKIVLNFENFKFGISTYLDNVKFSKTCTDKYSRCILIPSVYGFELDRVVDNKKSWLNSNTKVNRVYNALPERTTNYLEYDSRLIFNTKELELHVNPMKYVENDVVAYFDKFGTFYQEIDERLLDITVEKAKFEYIDVKNRQTIRRYSFLPTIYERYLDGIDCAPSKGLHYDYGLDIIKRTGTLWYKIVEQLVPTTAIWDSNQYILKNNVFDIQKHRYKRYSLDSGNGGDTEHCAPSGVTVTCERISSECFDVGLESIDDLLVEGISELICEQSGNTACFSGFEGDGSFSGRLIHYTESTGDTIDVIDLFGYQNYNYNCYTGDTPVIPDVISGCTNPLAINYNPLATFDDGSCIICPPEVSGCTYIGATNYNSLANVDDGSCVFISGVTGVTCTESIADFTCNLEYVKYSGNLHTFAMVLNSGTYVGGLTGSWSISGINHEKPIVTDVLVNQNYIQNITLTDIPVNIANYLEFGFHELTPAGVNITTPPSTTESPWFVGIVENSDLPLFVGGLAGVEIKINFVTDSGCIFTGSTTLTLSSVDYPAGLISAPITLTKIFP